MRRRAFVLVQQIKICQKPRRPNGNEDDLTAFMFDRNLPVDEIEAYRIAQGLLNNPPNIGYLTISNALQWRLQYRRIIEQAGQVEGILKIL